MYLKKLIGAFTALIMTVTVFAGSAVTVSAAYHENEEGKYKLNIRCNSETWKSSVDELTELTKFINNGYVFEHNGKKYMVTDGELTFFNDTLGAEVTVSEAVTLSIVGDISDNVTVIGLNNAVVVAAENGYVTAKDAIVSIIIMPPSEQQIKSVTIGGQEQEIDVPTSWKDTYTMNKDAKLEVVFAGTHTITVNQSTNGLVSPSKSIAMQGETVTMVIAPDTGYQLKNLKVTFNGIQVDAQGDGNNREFTMPGGNVTISAEFEQIPVYPQSPAVHIADYEDSGSTPASLWEGTLSGRNTAFYPKVTVKLNNNGEEKTAVGNTTIVGDGEIAIAVVVDKLENEIASVMLEGVAEKDASPTFNIETEGVDQ